MKEIAMKRIQWLVVLLLAAVLWPCGAWAQTPTPTVTPTPTLTPTRTPTPTATGTPTPGGAYGRAVVTPVAFGIQTLAPIANVSGARILAWTAAEITWFNSAVCTGNEILLVWNTHAADPGSVTISGATDAFGRTATIAAYNLDAGKIAFFGPFRSDAFRQTDGKLWFAGSADTVKFAVIRLP
jgi:hypothetical protein